jgi:hypothetical protein
VSPDVGILSWFTALAFCHFSWGRDFVFKKLICAVPLLLASTAAMATQLTGAGSLAGGNPIILPADNLIGAGPVDLGGVVWSSNAAASIFGSTAGYAFSNGIVAAGDPPMVLLNAGSLNGGYATMSLVFSAPTSGFLGEFFWIDGTSAGNSVNIAAYDKDDNLLDWIALNNNGNPIGKPAGYYGFSFGTASISKININNGYIGARNLSYVGPTIGGAPGVPEPASWMLMIAGVTLVGAMQRVRSSKARIAFA